MSDDPDRPTMEDVAHTPPTGESVTNVWHRGDEHAGSTDAASADAAAD